MTLLDRAVNFVDGVTKAPAWLRDQADSLNDRIIRISEDLQAATNIATSRAETNITNDKVKQLGGDFFAFIQDNSIWIVLGIAAIIGFKIWGKK